MTQAIISERSVSSMSGWPANQSSSPAQVYLGLVSGEAERVLGLMDREPFSPTRGCMDRTFWAWKFTDFPGARFQEGVCVLAFLYATPFEHNRFYQNSALRDWIAGGMAYWTRIQYGDGSFDEAYPFERSLAATAFTSFYVAEAYRMMGDHLPQQTAEQVRQALRLAGEWLIANDETHGFLSNHLAAAAAALLHIGQITGEERFEARSRYFVDKILAHQSEEGWYDEYGGADPGYQTHGSFYLARIWQLTGDENLAESLERSFRFLVHFLHPDGSLGGEYASRNTQTYYPAAFEMMSGASGTAHWIAQKMLPSVQTLSAAGLGSVDAYNYFPLLNNTIFAFLACLQADHRRSDIEAPPEQPGLLHFPEAGIVRVRNEHIDLYVGLTKGGVVKAFDRQTGRLICNDCGYLGRLNNGKLISSQWIDPKREVTVKKSEIVVTGSFYQISKAVMNPVKFMLFRVFSLTVGRLPKVSYWLKSLLVKTLIYGSEPLPITLSRAIRLNGDQIVIDDRLQGEIGDQIDALQQVDVFTTIHMGSSRYFIPNELLSGDADEGRAVALSKLGEGIYRERTVETD